MLDYISRRTLILRNEKNGTQSSCYFIKSLHHILLKEELYPLVQKNGCNGTYLKLTLKLIKWSQQWTEDRVQDPFLFFFSNRHTLKFLPV